MKFAEYQDLLPSEMLETVRNIHAELLAMGFTEEIKEAKSDPILSYTKDRKEYTPFYVDPMTEVVPKSTSIAIFIRFTLSASRGCGPFGDSGAGCFLSSRDTVRAGPQDADQVSGACSAGASFCGASRR